MPDLTREEFTRRFVEYMCRTAGFTEFDDGTDVRDYAAMTADSYWQDEDRRAEGPETCAEADMDCWGEED